MFVTQLKMVTALLLAAGGAAIGDGLLTNDSLANPQRQQGGGSGSSAATDDRDRIERTSLEVSGEEGGKALVSGEANADDAKRIREYYDRWMAVKAPELGLPPLDRPTAPNAELTA